MNSSTQTNGDFLKRGFTLLELLVVLALVSILSCLLFPALARTHIKSSGTGCVSNFRQMMVGWAMYMDENDDNLLPNSKPGDIGGATDGWYSDLVPNEDWYTSDSNTNAALYLNGSLAPYIGGHVELYRCPGDVLPSQNGRRIRSRSMSSQFSSVGNQVKDNDNLGWIEYVKGADLTCPDPKDLFVFADESFWTMNDGWLELDLTDPAFPDCPAAYHNGGGGFSFADGHAEIHKWTGPYKKDPNTPAGILGVVYEFGLTRSGSTHVTSSGEDADWFWLRQHASCDHP